MEASARFCSQAKRQHWLEYLMEAAELAPPIGMLLAAECYVRGKGRATVL